MFQESIRDVMSLPALAVHKLDSVEDDVTWNDVTGSWKYWSWGDYLEIVKKVAKSLIKVLLD